MRALKPDAVSGEDVARPSALANCLVDGVRDAVRDVGVVLVVEVWRALHVVAVLQNVVRLGQVVHRRAIRILASILLLL